MKDQAMNADDPGLTAYALGELSGEEAAQVAAAIERDPTLAAEVAEIRALTGGVEDALRAEELPETQPVEMAEHIEFPMDKRAPKRFPYYWVSGLAAAGFAVLVMVQSPESPLVGRETTIAAPRTQTSPPRVSMPGLEEPAAEPERLADDMLMEEADFSEKDRFEIAVTPTASPMPAAPTEVLQRPIPVVESTLPRDNVERLEERQREQVAVKTEAENEQRMLTAAATVEASRENYGDADGNRTIVLSEFAVQNSSDSTLSAAESKRAVESQNNWGGSVSVEAQPSSSLFVKGDITADDENGEFGKEGSGNLVVSNNISGTGSLNTQGSTRLVSSLRDSGAISISVPASSMMVHRRIIQPESHSGEDYAAIEEHGWKRVVDQPLSTFAVDVDSASYANVRRFLQSGNLPPMDAVKVEELVNAFSYDYRGPAVGSDAPLRANLEVAAAPWAPENRLVRIGLKAEEMPTSERGAANLVFLMDVSGSMNSPQKLPLVKEAMRLLLGKLRDDDRVAIVTYAGWSGLALPSTPVRDRQAIESVLRDLKPGGSTNGALGIHLAYDIAKANFVPGGVNRVILCTDGDFNVGTTGLGELGDLITEKAKSDVFLTALGFGMGNYQDDTLEQLANKGNGHHGYIDSVREARRLLVEQVEGTLNTVARDVKIQVEFNPAQVAAYRLIGYDNRRLAAEEFNDDTIDAGEIGAGHTVTALYEVIPADRESPVESHVDQLRYQVTTPYGSTTAEEAFHAEMLTVKLRAQPPEGGESSKWEFHLVDRGQSFDRASPDFKFAAAVAGFGLVLRDHPSVESTSLAQVEGWARSGITNDPGEYRAEFVELIGRADRLISQ